MRGRWGDDWPVIRCLVVWSSLFAALLLSIRLLAFPARPWSAEHLGSPVARIAVVVGVVLIAALLIRWLLRQDWGAWALLVLAVAVVVLLLPWEVKDRGKWLVLLIGAWLLALLLASVEFSRRLTRIATIVAVVLVLLSVVRFGRLALDDDKVADARGAAARLDTDLSKVEADAAERLADTEAAAAKAGTALDKALQPFRTTAGDCAPSGPGLLFACDVSAALSDFAATDDVAKQAEHLTRARERAAMVLRQFVRTGGTVEQNDLVDQVEAADAAAGAALGALDAGPDTETARASIAALCAAAGGPAVPPSGDDPRPCNRAAGRSPASTGKLRTAQALAERDLVSVRVDVDDSDSNKAKLVELEAALVLARNQEERPAAPVSALDALSKGGDELVSAVHGFDDRRIPLALTATGWVLVGLLALAFYRWLEIRSGRDGVGPVAVRDLLNTPAETKADLEAEFRRAVVRNVPEPGAVPGSDALQPLTDLVDATGDPASKVVKAVLGAVRAILGTPCGYDVDASLHAVGADRVEVFARIRDSRSKGTMQTWSGHAATRTLAVQAAGYWAAGWILERSRVVPEWASWTASSAEALAAYHHAGSLGEGAEAALESLETAVREAPTCGLAMLQLSYEYEFAGRHFDAMALNLRAALLFPRYLQGRYRLGISFGMMASDVDGRWYAASEADRAALVDLLGRFAALTSAAKAAQLVAVLRAPVPPGEDTLRPLFVAAAGEQLTAMERLGTWTRSSQNALRRDERAFWARGAVPWGGGHLDRTRVRQTAESAGLSMDRRAAAVDDLTKAGKLAAKLQRPDAWWQPVYNLACTYALPAGTGKTITDAARTEALRLLEHAAECRGADQLTAAWVTEDPDLAQLEDDPRFVRFTSHLKSGAGGAS